MAQRLLAKTAKFGVLKQSDWATKTTVSSNFKTILQNNKVTVPDPAVNITTFDYISSEGLLQEANRQYVDKYAELKKLPFAGFAHKEQLATELAYIFQDVIEYVGATVDTTADDNIIAIGTTTGFAIGQTVSIAGETFDGNATTTIIAVTAGTSISLLDAPDTGVGDALLTIVDYPKEFLINNDVIDFAANEGYVAGVAFQTYNDTSAGDGILLHKAIMDTYTLSINNEGTGTDKLLKREGTWVGNEITESLDFSGTWVAPPATPTYYKHFTLNLTIGSTTYSNICWKNFSMKIDRAVTPICMVNGYASNYLTMPTIEVTIDIPYTDDNYAIFNKYIAGENVEFNLSTITDGIANAYHGSNLTIQTDSGILKSNPYQYDGEYLGLRLVFDVTRPTTGLIPIVIFADGILGGY